MKRICFCLLFLLSLTFFSCAFAYTSGDWQYRMLTTDTCEITKYVGSEENVIIPEMISGNPVTSLSSFVFDDCTSVKTITVPQYVTKIDTYAFGAPNLQEFIVDINNSKFESIDGVLFRKSPRMLISYPPAAQSAQYTVPYGTITIESQAFWLCDNLQTLSFPHTLTTLNDASITWCSGLTYVELPLSVTSLGYEVFSYCSNLEAVYLPASILNIESYSLSGNAENFLLVVDKGTYAEKYAKLNDRDYIYLSEYQVRLTTVDNAISNSDNLTINNCPELRTILSIKSSNDTRYSDFAREYYGRTIEFDGSIDYITNHGSYTTRYDILLTAGDYDANHQLGPAFQFVDVNAHDLGLKTLYMEDEIWVGQNVHIVAEVVSFKTSTELFIIKPISVKGR